MVNKRKREEKGEFKVDGRCIVKDEVNGSEIDILSDSVVNNLFLKHTKEFRDAFEAKTPFCLHGPASRINKLKKVLFDLDVETYVSNTASDSIHVWTSASMSTSLSSMRSFTVDDAGEAAQHYADGKSLYCRAPPQIETLLVQALIKELKLGPTFPVNDRFVRGECETFISRKGHKTSRHTDFQENITIQLSGEKRWRFLGTHQSHPIRACTPHFNEFTSGRDVAEMQVKTALLADRNFTDHVKASLTGKEHSEVILKAGSVLYHPRGVWHEVECTSDSIAINVSLIAPSKAEILTTLLQQVLWKDKRWREPVRFGSGQGLDDMLLQNARETMSKLSREMISPFFCSNTSESMSQPKVINFDDENEEVEDEEEEEEEEEGEGDPNQISNTDLEIECTDEDEEIELEIEQCPRIANISTDTFENRKYHANPLCEIFTSDDVAAVGSKAVYAPLSDDDADWVGEEAAVRHRRGFAIIVHTGFGNDTVESLSRHTFWIDESDEALKTDWDRFYSDWKNDKYAGQDYDKRILVAMTSVGALY